MSVLTKQAPELSPHFLRGNIVLPVALATLLMVLSFQNFLLFHTLAELFAILIAIIMFAIAWQTYRFSHDEFLMYLSCGFFWIAIIDLLHALAYPGLNILTVTGTNTAVQYWIIARFFQAILLLSAPLFFVRRMPRQVYFGVFGTLTLITIFVVSSNMLPVLFVEGQGLTPLKIYAEYTIIALLTGALLHMAVKRKKIDRLSYIALSVAIVFTMVSELAFTYYVSVYGLSNMVGHIFKFAAFWTVFALIIRSALVAPYLNIQKAQRELERRVDERTYELLNTTHGLANAQRLAHLGSWSWDISSGEVIWSDEAFRIFGHEPGAFASSYEKFMEAVHPDDRERVQAAVSQGVKTGTPYAIEHKVLHPNGNVHYVAEQGEVYFNEAGVAVSMHGTVLDITEQKKARDDLTRETQERQSATSLVQRLSQAIDQSPNMVFITDVKGAIEYVNAKFIEVSGFTAQDAIGKNPNILSSGNTPKATYQDLWQTILGGRVWRGELEDLQKDGTHFWASVTIAPIREGGDGEITHFVSVHEDITQRKDAERQMHEAKEHAMAASRTKSEIMANMSHELRTPLNAIIGFSGTMKAEIFGPLDGKYAEYANDIHDSGEHLLALINDILDVSAIEAGKLELHEEDLDIGGVVGSAMQMVKHHADEGQVKLSQTVPKGLPLLFADNRRLKQILLNLLSNAIKFTPPNGEVKVSAALEDEKALAIVVQDTGIGMSPDELNKALSIFGQVDSGLNRKLEGTGLGLPLTIGLIELHNATYEIHSHKGQGTTVTVRFPLDRTIMM